MKFMKKLVILLVLVFCTNFRAAAESERPTIAIYVIGNVLENEKEALATRMLTALVNSGRYRVVERSNAYLNVIDAEHVKQRSGAIDDNQISALGKQLGAGFVCVANINPAYDKYQVSARILDVETAEVIVVGEGYSPMKTMNDMRVVSRDIVNAMFGERKFVIKYSAGGGVFGTANFGGGITSGAEDLAMPQYGGGAYLFFDATLATISVGYSMTGGKWKNLDSHSNSNPDHLPEMSQSSVHIGAFAKYPIILDSIRNIVMFPLLGVDYKYTTSATLKNADGQEIKFDGGTENWGGNAGNYTRPEANTLNALWFKGGAGVDFDIGGKIYMRVELMYGVRLGNEFEDGYVEDDKDGSTRLGHGGDVRVGVGYRF